jgi:hypothetical protein
MEINRVFVCWGWWGGANLGVLWIPAWLPVYRGSNGEFWSRAQSKAKQDMGRQTATFAVVAHSFACFFYFYFFNFWKLCAERAEPGDKARPSCELYEHGRPHRRPREKKKKAYSRALEDLVMIIGHGKGGGGGWGRDIRESGRRDLQWCVA